jgi:Replication protein
VTDESAWDASVLRTAPAPKAQGRGVREGAQRPSLGTYTEGLSTAAHSVVGKACRQWFALRDNPPRKVDRSDPRQVQAARDRARDERYVLRRKMRKRSKSKRVRACGRPGVAADGSVTLRLTEATADAPAVAGFGDLFSCASVWMCPVCSVRIAARRADELATVLGYFIERGGWAVLVTLTMRHYRGHPLAKCLAAASKGWTKVTAGRAGVELQGTSGYAGWCKALEVTESPENGWHVHLHVVVVFSERPSDDALDAMTGRMFAQWSRGLVLAGMPAPSEDYGIDVQKLPDNAPPDAMVENTRAWARYVAKGLAAEATLGSTKEAKGGNRSIRELMRAALIPQRYENPAVGDVVIMADETAGDRLDEYERAMTGRQQMTWSKGRWSLRAAAGLEEEQQSEEEIVAEELQGEDVAIIPAQSWDEVEPHATELLSVCERQGPDGARAWLDVHGIEWWRPTGLSEHFHRSIAPPGG